MACPPSLVANAVIYRASQAGRQFDHMQVHKLVFFVHAWSLALYNESLVAQKPEAWTYGPVFSSLYHRLKQYGASYIDKLLPEMHAETGQFVPLIPHLSDQRLWGLVDQVLSRYGQFSALQLSALTHEANGPWEITRNANRSLIDDDLIRNQFVQKLPNGSAA